MELGVLGADSPLVPFQKGGIGLRKRLGQVFFDGFVVLDFPVNDGEVFLELLQLRDHFLAMAFQDFSPCLDGIGLLTEQRCILLNLANGHARHA